MQDRAIRLDVYSRQNEASSIRRRPRIDDRKLATAMEALHQNGPRLVCELWAEVEELKARLGAVATPVPAPTKDAKAEAAKLVDALRDSR